MHAILVSSIGVVINGWILVTGVESRPLRPVQKPSMVSQRWEAFIDPPFRMPITNTHVCYSEKEDAKEERPSDDLAISCPPK